MSDDLYWGFDVSDDGFCGVAYRRTDDGHFELAHYAYISLEESA